MSDTATVPTASNKALVVDDLATERERLGGILREAGWQVETACSGVEAIERALAGVPHAVKVVIDVDPGAPL